MYIYIYIYSVCTYIYIYIERERDVTYTGTVSFQFIPQQNIPQHPHAVTHWTTVVYGSSIAQRRMITMVNDILFRTYVHS